MIEAAMLKVIQETGEGVLVLIDNVEADEFHRSRLTRLEVRRLLGAMAETLLSLSDAVQAAMPEIDWGTWRSVQQGLRVASVDSDELCWDAAHSLVPATLSWLRVYRRSEPALFEFKP
ncbi:hypothetical protein [Pelomonas cellulosilytica]|uniref:Uncharacterized protein n=1 Tax=Pelomonas cellulosilytica TaxID=2906762 RepID=A0ABS8XVY6_9BURK|nr:hypothetical protein [Pelomonas sp. P8]MCE4556826.1 hypothetical protein [Pelomonas sp. P8]